MKVFIPTINSEMVLKKPVEVIIRYENRNSKFLEKIGVVLDLWSDKVKSLDLVLMEKYGCAQDKDGVRITLPKGVTLKVSRIYIRNGAGDFDSVTFNAKGGGLPSGRFWLKLEDVNKMEIEEPKDIGTVNKEKADNAEKRQKKNAEKENRAFLKACADLEKSGYTWEDVVKEYTGCRYYNFKKIKADARKDKYNTYNMSYVRQYLQLFLGRMKRQELPVARQ